MAMNPMAGMGRPPAMGGMPPSMGVAPMGQAPSPQMGGGAAPSTGNVMQITSTLRGMSDQQLQQYAAMHKSDPFVFPLAFQESQTRQQMRAGQAAQMAGQKQPPVVDQDLQQMAPPQALPEEQGIGALNAPNLQRMADGGIAGYADGGQQPGMFNYAQMAPAVDLHPNSGVTPRSMAGGGIARSNYFSAGISREKMLEIVRDTNAQLPKPIEEMSDAELNAFMGDNRPIPVAPKGRHKASDYDMDLSPAGNLGANLIYGIGKGAVGAGNLTQQMIANKTKELEGVSAGQTRIGDYFTMPQSQYNTKYPVSTNLTNDTKKVASTSTETPTVENKEPPKVEDVLAEPTTSKTPWSPPTVVAPILKASGVPLGKAPTAEAAKQQANTFLNPDTFKADFENELTETGVGVAQQRALRDKMLAGRKTPYKDYEDRLKAQEAKEPEEKEKLTGLSLLEAGLAIMGGSSPYAFENLSKGAAGVKTYAEGIKDLKKSKDLRDRAFADIEQARTSQANNDIDRSIEFEDRASSKMQEARRWSISGQQNLGLKNAEMASHNFDTANTNYFADRRTNAEIAGRTNEANARLGLEAIKMNMPPEAIRTAQYLGEGNVQTGYNMGVAKQHATELYTKWGQLAYPNGNMGQPNEAFLKMYPSATAYVKEGLEAAGFGKTSNDGFTTDLPKGANVLQPSKK
jgi:hypothetical protein